MSIALIKLVLDLKQLIRRKSFLKEVFCTNIYLLKISLDEILKDASLDEISQQKYEYFISKIIKCINYFNIYRTKLSQDEIDYLDDKNSSSRLEESKIRHKKTPAISLKNNFLSAIKDLNLSNRNDAGKKIKYPKHDSSQIKTHVYK